MKIIGLTGGSGAGKGEVCRAFLAKGIDSIDTDKISRDVTRKGSPCLRELVENFSGSILTDYGELDRKKLADIAFSSKENLERLNNITHKHILNECSSWILGMAKANRKAIVIDAPLLFESNFDRTCDIVISVIADLDKRINRIIKRDNISLEQAERRIKNQKTDEFFIQNSNYVVYNNTDYGDVFIQVSNIYRNIFPQEF
ncbi:MAG: dephospho-CoA kinase [Oscillospiraceae bacterium]|nr:dephospho-CoA kinase [Oscillospiraceae bacterium]